MDGEVGMSKKQSQHKKKSSSRRISKVASTVSFGAKPKPPPKSRSGKTVFKRDLRGLSDPLGLPKNVDGTFVSQPITPLSLHQHQLIAGNGPTGLARFQTRAAFQVVDKPIIQTRLTRLRASNKTG